MKQIKQNILEGETPFEIESKQKRTWKGDNAYPNVSSKSNK